MHMHGHTHAIGCVFRHGLVIKDIMSLSIGSKLTKKHDLFTLQNLRSLSIMEVGNNYKNKKPLYLNSHNNSRNVVLLFQQNLKRFTFKLETWLKRLKRFIFPEA